MEHAHRYSLRETREQNEKNDQLRKNNQKPVIKCPDFLGVAKSPVFFDDVEILMLHFLEFADVALIAQ